MENLIMYATQLALALGILAFLTSVIIEMIKNLPWLKTIATDLVVLFVANVLTVISMVIYCQYQAFPVLWYYWVGAIVGGFIVAFLAMNGWTKLTEMWKRFKPPVTPTEENQDKIN